MMIIKVLSYRQSPHAIYPRDCVPVFFAFGSDRKRIRPLRLVQPSRLVFNYIYFNDNRDTPCAL